MGLGSKLEKRAHSRSFQRNDLVLDADIIALMSREQWSFPLNRGFSLTQY